MKAYTNYHNLVKIFRINKSAKNLCFLLRIFLKLNFDKHPKFDQIFIFPLNLKDYPNYHNLKEYPFNNSVYIP